jgi:hypothetical protein
MFLLCIVIKSCNIDDVNLYFQITTDNGRKALFTGYLTGEFYTVYSRLLKGIFTVVTFKN